MVIAFGDRRRHHDRSRLVLRRPARRRPTAAALLLADLQLRPTACAAPPTGSSASARWSSSSAASSPWCGCSTWPLARGHGVSYPTFLALDVVAALAWTSTWVGLGWFLGDRWSERLRRSALGGRGARSRRGAGPHRLSGLASSPSALRGRSRRLTPRNHLTLVPSAARPGVASCPRYGCGWLRRAGARGSCQARRSGSTPSTSRTPPA